MSLWVDKYRPKDLQKLDYHNEQAATLEKLAKQPDFPHLFFYGPCGSGKKTRILCLLKELFGPAVDRLKQETINFTTPSNKQLEIKILSSPYHVEVDPSEARIYDRIVVTELIKHVAQNQQFDSNGQKEFKVVILSNVDELTKDAQHALRRTMEKYVSSCRLILCGNSVSRTIPAIRSRCISIKVAAPSLDEITTILLNICKKEGLNLPRQLAENIAKKSNRNLRRAILMCEECKVEQYPFVVDQNIKEPDWLVFIRGIASKACKDQSIETLMSIREDFYELIVHGIPGDVIFRTLLKELLKNCDLELKSQIIESAAFYETRLKLGSTSIFHFEAFIVKFMCLYRKFLGEIADIF